MAFDTKNVKKIHCCFRRAVQFNRSCCYLDLALILPSDGRGIFRIFGHSKLSGFR